MSAACSVPSVLCASVHTHTDIRIRSAQDVQWACGPLIARQGGLAFSQERAGRYGTRDTCGR
eukprot:scaffold34503_cov129-Isochrysis_galbana.AAC.4